VDNALSPLVADQKGDRSVFTGVVATNITPASDWLKRKLLISPNQGAQTLLRAVTDPSVISGSYLHNTRGMVDFSEQDPAMDVVRRREFWEECEQAIASYLI